MELKKLKVVTSRMAGYTGVLGPVRFKDGVSEEPLPRHIRDRMAASMELIEIDADGNEQPAGAQYRMIESARTRERAPLLTSLQRQSDAEKAQELAQHVLAFSKTPHLETRESLELIAGKGGIRALREVAEKWNVKHRSIPTLIEMILGAQEKFMVSHKKKIIEATAANSAAAEEIAAKAEPSPAPAPVEEKPADTNIADAAATGDLSAAINETDVLIGSNNFESVYHIAGSDVTLGNLVSDAFMKSGASVEEWNALSEADRDDFIRAELERMTAGE